MNQYFVEAHIEEIEHLCNHYIHLYETGEMFEDYDPQTVNTELFAKAVKQIYVDYLEE